MLGEFVPGESWYLIGRDAPEGSMSREGQTMQRDRAVFFAAVPNYNLSRPENGGPTSLLSYV